MAPISGGGGTTPGGTPPPVGTMADGWLDVAGIIPPDGSGEGGAVGIPGCGGRGGAVGPTGG